ncbi:hypothetical protein [Desertibaculum subflavum]|uniref:hypothetical protein n=1 Tax=Desertibaculum subflavum TaxID=2268458 RepID=UPI000E661A15
MRADFGSNLLRIAILAIALLTWAGVGPMGGTDPAIAQQSDGKDKKDGKDGPKPCPNPPCG